MNSEVIVCPWASVLESLLQVIRFQAAEQNYLTPKVMAFLFQPVS